MSGNAGTAEVESIANHVESCVHCEQTLRQINVDDTLAMQMRTEAGRIDKPADPAVQKLIERVRQRTQTPSDATAAFAHDGSQSPLSGADRATSAVTGSEELSFLAPPQARDEIGRLGQYRVLKVLGKGGMGMVLKGHDPQLDRLVALKVMLPHVAADETFKQRFLREARAAAKLNSDHIVTIYQVSEDRGIPFLAMEYLEGAPLDQYLASGRQLTLAQILRVAREVAKGLADAHEQGLIHRDIKPGNIWLDKKNGGRSKILDFGLARAHDDVNCTQSGTILGTPAYMAPEQARGEKVDGRADLFSLGCILYRLSSGDLPFKGDTTMAILMSLALNEPTAPHKINEAIPEWLSDLIMQLLEKEAIKRPASAREMLERINRADRPLSKAGAQSSTNIAPAAEVLPVKTAAPMPPEAVLAKPAAAPPKQRRPNAKLIGGAGALFALLLAGILFQFTFKTESGTLIVQVDQDADVRFKAGKLEIREPGSGKLLYTLSPSEKNKKLPPGEYLIDIVGADGLTLNSNEFKLDNNGERSVHVRVATPEVARTGNASETPIAPPDLQIAASVLDQLDPSKIPAEEREPNQPKELVAVVGSRQMRHWGRINCVTTSPDGKTIVSGGQDDCAVRLWDAATLQEKAIFELSSGIAFVQYLPDGKTLVVRSFNGNGTVSLWDVTTPKPKEISVPKGSGRDIANLAVSTEVPMVAFILSKDKSLRVWDLSTNTAKEYSVPLPKDLQDFRSLAISHDGKKIALSLQLNIAPKDVVDLRWWEWSDGEYKEQTPLPPSKGRQGYRSVAFSHDGKLLADALPNEIVLWDMSTKEATKKMAISKRDARELAFSRDGKSLAFSTYVDTAQFADLTGAWPRLTSIPITRGPIAVSPDSKFLVATGDTNDVRVFDLSGSTPTQRTERQESIHRFAFTPDGKTLAGRGNDSTYIWDINAERIKKRTVIRHTGANALGPVAISTDGKLLAQSFHNVAAVWNLSKDEPSVLDIFKTEVGADHGSKMVFLPNSRTLAIGTESGVVQLVEVTDKMTLKKSFGGHSKRISHLNVSADRKSMVCHSYVDGTAQFWDLSGSEPAKGKLLQLESPMQIHSLELSPDGRTLVTRVANVPKFGQQYWLWEIAGSEIKRKAVWDNGKDFGLFPPAYSPDSRFVAQAFNGKGTVMLWDAVTGAKVRELKTPGAVVGFRFAPDGRHLVIGNSNGTLYFLRLIENASKNSAKTESPNLQ